MFFRSKTLNQQNSCLLSHNIIENPSNNTSVLCDFLLLNDQTFYRFKYAFLGRMDKLWYSLFTVGIYNDGVLFWWDWGECILFLNSSSGKEIRLVFLDLFREFQNYDSNLQDHFFITANNRGYNRTRSTKKERVWLGLILFCFLIAAHGLIYNSNF